MTETLVAEQATTSIENLERYGALCDATASGSEQAAVRYVKDGKVLDLCAHHQHVHDLDLQVNGWTVHSTVTE